MFGALVVCFSVFAFSPMTAETEMGQKSREGTPHFLKFSNLWRRCFSGLSSLWTIKRKMKVLHELNLKMYFCVDEAEFNF